MDPLQHNAFLAIHLQYINIFIVLTHHAWLIVQVDTGIMFRTAHRAHQPAPYVVPLQIAQLVCLGIIPLELFV